jgi:uncharacterized protein YkwD
MKKKIAIIFLLIFFFPLNQTSASSVLGQRLAGRILLAVEQKGGIWYVDPVGLKRYSLSDPIAAAKAVGIGISNKDLAKFPLAGVSTENISTVDKKFIAKNNGKIFLQVENRGEIWYVNPLDGRRYSLNSASDAKLLAQKFGLGISNANLSQIAIAQFNSGSTTVSISSPYDLNYLEQKINSLVNAERAKEGLSALAWNSDVAAVARRHSNDLAEENKSLTGLNKGCDYFIIHHEGFGFGLYQDDRLKNSGIYYFSASGENIAMQSGKSFTYLSKSNGGEGKLIEQCVAAIDSSNESLKEALESDISTTTKEKLIKEEIDKRKTEFAAEKTLNIVGMDYTGADEMASDIVSSWMNSAGHRANILNSSYNESGIGIAYVNGYVIATQDFITHVSCGYNGAACCAHYSCYVPNSCQNNNICR